MLVRCNTAKEIITSLSLALPNIHTYIHTYIYTYIHTHTLIYSDPNDSKMQRARFTSCRPKQTRPNWPFNSHWVRPGQLKAADLSYSFPIWQPGRLAREFLIDQCHRNRWRYLLSLSHNLSYKFSYQKASKSSVIRNTLLHTKEWIEWKLIR